MNEKWQFIFQGAVLQLLFGRRREFQGLIQIFDEPIAGLSFSFFFSFYFFAAKFISETVTFVL